MSGLATVGLIGTGVMGLPMGRRLLAAGHPLVVHSRTEHRAATLVEAGARLVADPSIVACESDVVITMLPDGPDVLEVADGPTGLFAGLRSGATWIDMSSISPVTARALAERTRGVGADWLDAPVSGGERGAIDGTLSIMVGGSIEVMERWRPLLEHLGKLTFIGPPGAGQVAKCANQVVVGVSIAVVAEALAMVARSGIDREAVWQALMGGFAQSRVLEVHGRRMLDDAHEPGFRARLHAKDLFNALEMARDAQAAAPLTATVAQAFVELEAEGYGDYDHSALSILHDPDRGRAPRA